MKESNPRKERFFELWPLGFSFSPDEFGYRDMCVPTIDKLMMPKTDGRKYGLCQNDRYVVQKVQINDGIPLLR